MIDAPTRCGYDPAGSGRTGAGAVSLDAMSTSLSFAPVTRRWVQRGAATDTAHAVAALESSLQLPSLLCKLLLRRGYTSSSNAKTFLKPRLDQLHNPHLLAGMDAAVDRIQHAIRNGETVLVHGDYDVDGVCSATVYTRVLRRVGVRVVPFVPHRMRDGYDLSESGVRAAAEAGATLILTGDCGIVAHDSIEAARSTGIDVIVTDHHTPGDVLPAAVAVVNPNRRDCEYPEKGLCGAGVAFKLCQAIAARNGIPEDELWYLLDFVALATIADLAPLTGENRTLTRYGLRLMPQTQNIGLRALINASGLGGLEHLTAGQVSHVLAPRINAAGRMSAAAKGVQLFLEENERTAAALAAELDDENRLRQTVDRETLAQAMQMLESSYDPSSDYVVVLGDEAWHPGVIGIVASRVVERLHRPTVLFSIDRTTGRARGSARSIPGFHLYDGLKSCSHFLDRFGGHKYAAGMDMQPERMDAFRAALNEYAHQVLAPEDLIPEVDYDVEISFRDITAATYKLLRHFGPFGVGNPSPVFITRGARIVGQREVGDGHLKLTLSHDGVQLPAIGFSMAARFREMDLTRSPVDLAFQIQEDTWNGRSQLQARLVDLRLAE